MIEVEIYFGIYVGDSQVWDTECVLIGEESEDPATDALNNFDEQIAPKIPNIAFRGVFNIREADEDEV